MTNLSRITGMKVNSVSQAAYVYDPTVTYGGKIGNMTSAIEGGSVQWLTRPSRCTRWTR